MRQPASPHDQEKECYAYRNECFEYLHQQHPSEFKRGKRLEYAEPGILPLRSLQLHAQSPGYTENGIPVPLFNLVFQHCLIIPWLMEKVSDNEDYMLYALINGGIPYLLRDGAYPGMDGAFSENQREKLIEDINRSKVLAELSREDRYEELSHHEILDDAGLVQRARLETAPR